MSARKQVNWRMSSNGRALSRRDDPPFNDTLQSALLDVDNRMSAKWSSASVNLHEDAHGAAVYVCAVISVYALFVVVFVAILFAVRRRRQPKSRRLGADTDGVGRLGSYLVNRDVSVRVPPPPPPPRLRSNSSTSASPVRRSSRSRRCRSVAAGSTGNRAGRWRGDELVVPPRGRSMNDTDTRRAVSASPIDDVITLIQVL